MKNCRIGQEVMDQEEKGAPGVSELAGQKHEGREAWEGRCTEGVESRSMKGHP